jgi:predicted metal-binding protein
MTDGNTDSNAMIDAALGAGASSATVIDTDRIHVDDRFRTFCEEPRCPNFDTSSHCPPHCEGPDDFRKLLQRFRSALVVRFDAPADALSPEDRRVVGRLLHDLTADVVGLARAAGFTEAAGFSSGGCKNTYCHDHPECAALAPAGECRFPDRARTSLSALGVDVQHLLREAGWIGREQALKGASAAEGTVMMVGVVLLD